MCLCIAKAWFLVPRTKLTFVYFLQIKSKLFIWSWLLADAKTKKQVEQKNWGTKFHPYKGIIQGETKRVGIIITPHYVYHVWRGYTLPGQ